MDAAPRAVPDEHYDFKAMKPWIALVPALAVFALQAGPLKPAQVGADARWVLHLDAEAFRSSKSGGYVCSELLDKKLAEIPKGDANLDLVGLARKITGLTLYGPDFENRSGRGVLLVTANEDVVKALEGLAAAEMLRKPDGPIKRIQDKPFPLFQLKSDSFVGSPGPGLILLAKSREQVEAAAAVLDGSKPSLNGAAHFKGLPSPPAGTFLCAMAEAFNELGSIPPQARVLQMAEAGRLALGESREKLTLNLALRAKTAEASAQMRQVVEGLAALVSLSDTTDKDLATLVKSLKVTNTDTLVSLTVEFPVADAIQKAAQKHGTSVPKP
jgi:hypothetical protein